MSRVRSTTLVPDNKPLLDRDEAAIYLTNRGFRTSRHGILRLRSKGLHPVNMEKTGGRALWKPSDLDEWIESL